MNIPIPLPNPLDTTETVLIGFLLLFFAAWGWRHGLDASIIAGLIVMFGAWAAPELTAPLGKIINGTLGFFPLFTSGQFSMDNLSAVVNAQSEVVQASVNVQDPNSSSMQLLTMALFVIFAIIGFRYANQKAGGKDPLIASFFGLLGAVVVGYICIRFVIDRILTFPQTVTIAQSDIPTINVNATMLVAMVLVLVVYGIQHSKPPGKKG